jgi:hypothetical protein
VVAVGGPVEPGPQVGSELLHAHGVGHGRTLHRKVYTVQGVDTVASHPLRIGWVHKTPRRRRSISLDAAPSDTATAGVAWATASTPSRSVLARVQAALVGALAGFWVLNHPTLSEGVLEGVVPGFPDPA